MINPVFLKTFIKLVDTHHFTRTAELLNMTQPGVSQHIKKLEEQLGVTLLNRFGKSFELTDAGERLFIFGTQQMKAETEFVNNIAQDSKYQGNCKIACSGSIATQLYPECLKLQKQFPGLSFSLEAAPNSKVIECIRTKQFDMGIVTQAINDPKIAQERLGNDSLCLVLPVGEKINWLSLLKLGFVNHPDGYHYANQILSINFVDNFQGMEKITQSSYINQLDQILLPVAEGLGFSVIPKSAFDNSPYKEKIQAAPLSHQIEETVYLITKRGRILPSRYELIEEVLNKKWKTP